MEQNSLDIGLLMSGCFFFFLGFWQIVQVTKKYFQCYQKRIEFTSNITYQCGRSCQSKPVEGIIKLICCMTIVIYCLASAVNFGQSSTIVHYVDLCHTTIFFFFSISSVFDIVKQVKGRLFIDHLDYAVLALSFAVQAVLYGFHVPDKYPEEWIINSLMMYSALSCCASVVLEVIKPQHIVSPVLRSYTTMVLGSWLIQSTILLSDPLANSEIESHHRVLIIAMYYAWHLAVDLIIVVCTWMSTHRLLVQHKCCCLPTEVDASSDIVFLENRISCDYHVMDRIEYDLD